VLLDALGTLVELEPPWLPLAIELEMDPADVAPAVRAEMDFYKEHAHEGRDEESLTALRRRCAEILSWELDREVSVETMMDAIQFRAFDDARPALNELRRAGLRLVCVSNWDISLPEVLAKCGLGDAVDGIVTDADWQGRVGEFFNSVEKANSLVEPAIARYDRRELQHAFLDEPECRYVIQQFVIDE